MKKGILYFLLIGILFSCEKNNNQEQGNEINVGVVYYDYTEGVENQCDIQFNITDENYSFNKSEAYYSSHKPSSNQNVFRINLSDTLTNETIRLEIYTAFMDPEDFFKKSTLVIDTIKIGWSGVTEDFINSEAILSWDTASFDNYRFTGKATLNITKRFVGIINPETYYPEQELVFIFE